MILENYEKWLRRGLNLTSDNKFQESVLYFNKILKIRMDSIKSYYNKALHQRRLKNYLKAEELYKKTLRLNYILINACVQKGANLFAINEEKEAKICLKRVHDLGKYLEQAWFHFGITLKHLNKRKDAIIYLKRAAGINPNNYMAWYNLGNLYGYLEKINHEVICYNKVLNIKPDYYNAWYNKGVALMHLMKFKNALTCFNRALEINPNLSNSWNNKGIILLSFSYLDEAIKCFEKAIETDPNSIFGRGNKSNTLMIFKRFDEAIEGFNEILRINPKDIISLNNKGAAFMGLERYDDALECLNKVIKIEPNYPSSLQNIGITYINMHNYKKAANELRKAREIFKSMNLVHLVNKIQKYLLWAINADELFKELPNLDKSFLKCLKSQNIKKLQTNSIKLLEESHDILDDFSSREFPDDVKDLLYSKSICFSSLAYILKFGQVDTEKLNKTKIIFHKWSFNNFERAVNSIENFYHNIKEYNCIEEIPYDKELELLSILRGANYIDGELSFAIDSIFGVDLIPDIRFLEGIPEFLRSFIIRQSYRTKIKIDIYSNPIRVYTGYPEFDFELNSQLLELRFWEINKKLSSDAQLWLDCLGSLIFLLDQCYQHSNFFRDEAQSWDYEPRDMNPWMSNRLSILYRGELEDKKGVSDGDADHWIKDIPLEDKLVRASNITDIDQFMVYIYNKHKNQIFREAGRSGFGFFTVADIREEIKKGKLPNSPIKKCFKVFYENNCWIALFVFQAFTGTPSNTKSI